MGPKKKRIPLPKEVVKERLRQRKKIAKQNLKTKRAKLIVRNLSFQVNEEKLKELFSQYGEISSVNLLKHPDGKLVGCAFVQFNAVQNAAKAKHYTNGKDFLGRKLEVDFSKPKNKYSTNKVQIKTDGHDLCSNQDEHLLENKESSEDEERDMEEIVSNKSSEEEKDEEKNTQENTPHFSHDISEGKTIFVKNVPFQATNDDLKKCMMQFGRIYYALICIDKFTEHSKGTAFVKFVNKEDAEKVLNAGTELKLLGNILDCQIALDRKEIKSKLNDKLIHNTEPKDSRNLYLVKEGVISPGSSAAEGVSASDMVKRAQIERYKTQMLKKLNMFVSKERLVVHNLPANWDDKKVKILFEKYGGPGAVVKEARVMRDRKNLDANGIGASKQYGFVSFTKHENALTALRSLNNNPNIFSTNKRPIIVFSIENRAAITAKKKRLEKSKKENQSENDTQQSTTKKRKLVKFKKFLERKKEKSKKADSLE